MTGESWRGQPFLTRDWDAESARLAARALQAGEPTAWFDELYAGGRNDEIDMPWDRPEAGRYAAVSALERLLAATGRDSLQESNGPA